MMPEVGTTAYLRQIHAIVGRRDARPGLPGYRCPTLLICGHEHGITPLATHESMAAPIPGARLAVVEQCGHMSTMQQPQAVTALIAAVAAVLSPRMHLQDFQRVQLRR